MPTKLYFDKADTLTVDEDLSAVEAALRGAPPSPAAVVQFTKKGKKVFVNAALVRRFAEHEARSGVAFG